MNDGSAPKKGIRVGTVMRVAVLIIMLVGAWPFIAFNKEFRRCIELKNGLNLGYEAVFDLSRPALFPIAVPKFPDGTPLIDEEMWGLFVTDTTIYGNPINDRGERFSGFGWRDSFVWRADTGLVREKEDRETYLKIISEAGEANFGITGSRGPVVLMRIFAERPEYTYRWCRTKLITW